MHRFNYIAVVAFLWIGLMAVLVLSDARSHTVAAMGENLPDRQAASPTSAVKAAKSARPASKHSIPEVAAVPVEEKQPEAEPPVLEVDPTDPDLVLAPYRGYILTQGPHGYSYGQAAIDLTAGKGAEIGSPINGTVSQLFTDDLGNPTLVIDNTRYQVTLMHGDYTVQPGDTLTAGQMVGYESNNGNTIDWAGRSCRGRDCGYHTHLNIFDKQAGANIDPRLLIPASE